MKIKIDKEKLESLTSKELVDIENSCFIESRFCIGEIEGKQIILVVTEDGDSMFEETTEAHLCVEKVATE